MHLPLKRAIILLFVMLNSMARAYGDAPQTRNLSFPEAEMVTKNTVRIPFQIIDHLIVVKAEVSGRKGNFIVDTGAEALVLNSVHFKNYNKRKYRTTAGVSGTIDNVYLKRLDHFFLKGFSIDRVSADVINLSHLEKSKKTEFLGIIGHAILKDYEIFIDFYLKQITLFRTDKEGNRIDKQILLEKIADSISFNQKKHTIVIDAFINGEKVIFGMDTGAEINQLNNTVSKKVLENFKPLKRVNMIGAGGHKREVIAGKLYRVKFTNTTYAGVMRTIVTNLSEMHNAYGTHLDGILGYEFLVNRRMLINYKKKKLYFIAHPQLRNQ